MREFLIHNIENTVLEKNIKAKFTKRAIPYGSFGLLEDFYIRLCVVQNTEKPQIKKPALFIFSGDHGIVKDVSIPQDSFLSYQKASAFLHKSAPINFACSQAKIQLKLIDVGINHYFEGTLSYWLNNGSWFINQKIDFGTKSFAHYPSMTTEQCLHAIDIGAEQVDKQHIKHCNCIGLTSIGNGHQYSCVALIMALLEVPYKKLNPHYNTKEFTVYRNIEKWVKKHPKTHDPLTILTLYGGFEIAALVGAMLQAAESKMLICIDSLPAAVALLIAQRINTNVLQWVVFVNADDDSIYNYLLKHFKVKALLSTQTHIDNGVGIALSIPLIQQNIEMIKGLLQTEDIDF